MTEGARCSELIERAQRACARLGFDLVQPLAVGWYNSVVEGSLRLEELGSGQHLALLIGNTRALWPVWLDALGRDPGLASSPDPLDAYTERSVAQVIEALGVQAVARFSHETGERTVAMQRLAHVAGLAYLSETHLSVHPTYGPWIALRAAVTFALPGPAGPPPALQHPCGGCARGCWPAFERALGALGAPSDTPPSEAGVRGAWRAWATFRGACPVGREHRYPEPMLRYHYTKDSELLRRAQQGR